MTAADFFARWRVRLGYVLAVVLLILARPTPQSILFGGLIGLLGLWIRAHAAGHLHKQEILTTTGLYAHTRNPLYLGSGFLAIGAAVAMRSWIGGSLMLIYFTLVYSFVMRREERELQLQHPDTFAEYAASVPRFFPRLIARVQPGAPSGSFSWAQYKKNHEYEAMIGFVLLLIALTVIWRVRAA
jgi:protein-S-isoprenylcysteine O-methyltransferase Ste14